MRSTYTVWLRDYRGRTPEVIGGPFAVVVVDDRDGSTVSSCTNVRTLEAARRRASEYSWSFGLYGKAAPIREELSGMAAATLSAGPL